ncbi:MAG: AAA family ATPase [Aquabacterium sp.]|uniref:AAA family ATPase n=1 Tax=Aquabacterium sp. TaxID=1872578 RepID=UPI003BC155B1
MSMQLTRLRVAQLRQFRQAFELADLTPGLNIFTGPNEAGKSTLVRAIRAAFFERYRSKVVEDLRPWGDASATPQVEVDFQLGQQSVQLFKSFLGTRARCSLTVNGQTKDGAEAEDLLAQWLGFSYAAKGASRPEHWGIPGLLWIEQGTGQALGDPAGHAQDHIRQALAARQDAALGSEVAASLGDELLAQFQAQLDELQTATGKPRAAYLAAIQAAEQLQRDMADLDERIARYQQDVDQLSTLRRQHQQEALERPWDAVKDKLAQARQAEQAVAQRVQQLADAEQGLVRLQQQEALLQAQVRSVTQLQAARMQREQDAARAAEQWQAADAACRVAQQLADDRAQHVQRDRMLLAAARQDANRRLLLSQRQEADAAAQRYQQVLTDAVARSDSLAQLKVSMTAPVLQKADVEALRQLEKQWQTLQVQRQAIATRLQYTLQPGQTMALEGDATVPPLTGEGELLIAEPLSLHVPGVGRLRITPGGQDVALLAQQCAQVERTLQDHLQRLGLAGMPEVERRYESQQDLAAQIKLAEQALQWIAPQGLAPLRQALAQAHQQIAACDQALQALPESASEPVQGMAAAEAALHDSERLESAAREALTQALQARARAEAEQVAAQREVALVQAQLADPEHVVRHQQALSSLAQVTQDAQVQRALVQELMRQRDEARPDILQQEIARLGRSIALMEQAHQQRHTRIQVLEGTLQQVGAQGLEEQRQVLAGEHARAKQRVAELQRRAGALSLLCQQFQQKRRDALERLQAPLKKHLEHYLRLLFPHAQVAVSDQLTPDYLIRRLASGEEERGQFDALSFGAREQLAVISRLAYADLLKEAGRPTLLILDDALVHSDADRLERMKRVLFDAAQRHQVLMFTCHPDHWSDMGVPVRSLMA